MKNKLTYLVLVLMLLMPKAAVLHAGDPGEDIEVKLYPNPSDGVFTIEFEQDGHDELSARIYDMTGKMVMDFEDEIRQDGRDVKLEVNLENPASGIYFLKIESGKLRITRKIVIR